VLYELFSLLQEMIFYAPVIKNVSANMGPVLIVDDVMGLV